MNVIDQNGAGRMSCVMEGDFHANYRESKNQEDEISGEWFDIEYEKTE